jgi:putative FmdB family regulatory protein
MPIYEFYCPDCHTVFSFFSVRIAPDAAPACPRCARPGLARRPSRFATLRHSGGGEEAPGGDDLFAGLDESRLERAMEQLAGEVGDLEGDGPQDPRQVSRFLRRFSDLTGLEAGPKMREMLDRLDRGEDPDRLEQEMGAGDDDEDLAELFRLKPAALARRLRRPKVDETLYFL